jgi:hypothetical protein
VIAPMCGGFTRDESGRLVPPRMFSDPGADERFWEEGFVKLPLLTPEAIERLADGFAGLRPGDNFDPRSVDGARCTYHCTFLDHDRDYRRAADQLVRDLFDERLSAALPGYRILSSNIYVKPPGAGRFEIHQNWPTIDELDVPTITVWVPLQDTNLRNGTIRVVPGGHHIFPDVAAASSDRFFDDFADELIENYLEPVDVHAGEALFFDDSLLHWSGANRSSTPRVTFQIEMVPTDANTVLWVRNPDDPTEFELWDMDTDFWIHYDLDSVLARPHGLRRVGTRPNPNRRLSLEQFQDVMARGPAIRAAKYALPASAPT